MSSLMTTLREFWQGVCCSCMKKVDMLNCAFNLQKNPDLKAVVDSVLPSIVLALDLSPIICKECFKEVYYYAEFVFIAMNVMRNQRRTDVKLLKNCKHALCYTCARPISISPSVAEYPVAKLRAKVVKDTGFDAVAYLGLDEEGHVCVLCYLNVLSYAEFRKRCERIAIAKTGQPVDSDGCVRFDDLPGIFCMRSSRWIVGKDQYTKEIVCKLDLFPMNDMPTQHFGAGGNLDSSQDLSSLSQARLNFKKMALVGTRGFVMSNGNSWTERFHCGECGLDFATSWKFGAHERLAHNVSHPFCCFLCPKMNRFLKYLQFHLEIDHSSFKSRKIDKMFSERLESLAPESMKAMFSMYPAPCEMDLSQPVIVDPCHSYLFGQNEGHADTTEGDDQFGTTGPQITIANQRLQCDICDKVFFNQNDLKMHRSQHTRGKDQMFPCRRCTMLFPTRKDLRAHEQFHRQEKRLTKAQKAILNN